MQRYLNFGYLAIVLGGAGLVVAGVATAIGWVTPFSAEVTTTSFIAAAAVRLLAITALLVGFAALYVRQADRAGRLGLVAYLATVVALVLLAGTMFTDLFVSGALAQHAPGIVDGTEENARMSMGFLLAWAMNLTFVLLGAATLRARVFMRLVGWALIAMGLLPLIPLPVDVPVSEIAIGGACIVVGLAARRVVPIRGLASDSAKVPSIA